MTKLVIFGTGDIAELAHYYYTKDTAHEVVGFTVDAAYMSTERFCGCPVVAFEEVAAAFPADSHQLFVALSYAKLNAIRREKYNAAKLLGYTLASYVSSRACVLNDGRIGDNCFILEDNTIQPFARIGNNVTLWSGNHIGHHSSIGDHVMITSHVVISGGCTIEPHCFFGVNSTIRDETTIGRETLVGAGVTILADTEPYSVFKHPGAKAVEGLRSDQLRSISHKSGG